MKLFILISCLTGFAFGLSPAVIQASPKPPSSPPLQLFLKEIASSEKMMNSFESTFAQVQKPVAGINSLLYFCFYFLIMNYIEKQLKNVIQIYLIFFNHQYTIQFIFYYILTIGVCNIIDNNFLQNYLIFF